MVLNREEAVSRALTSKTFAAGMCQLWTRTMFGAPSVGDQDRDGDADAVDGWKSEPASAKHTDRKPPRGVPVAFTGGSRGFGHRAISLGNGLIRGTDMRDGRYQAGVVGNATISQIESSMGVKYAGWSETISGQVIPKPPVEMTRGRRIDQAIKDLRNAKGTGTRGSIIKSALSDLLKIKRFPKK
jgi:hypothetical protein